MQFEGSMIRLTTGECGHWTECCLGHSGSVSNVWYYLKFGRQRK